MKSTWIKVVATALFFIAGNLSADTVEGEVSALNLKKNTLKLSNKKYKFNSTLKVSINAQNTEFISIKEMTNGMIVKIEFDKNQRKRRFIKRMTLLIH